MKLRIRHGRAALALLLGLAAGAARAEPIHLKLAMFSADTERTYVDVIKPWIDAVNAAGQGVVQVDAFPNGALGKALPEQPQMVLDGVADIAFVIPGVTPGRFPDNEVMDLPGLFATSRDATLVYTRLLEKGVLKGFERYRVLGAMGTPPFWIDSKSRITSLAEIRGKKLRGTNPSQSATLKALGAVPVLLPVTEVPEAIGRGTIDGATEFPGPLVDFGIDRVTKYDYALPVGISSLTLLMNRDRYDGLPAPARAVLDRFGPDWVADRFTGGYGSYLATLYQKLGADRARVRTEPSAEDAKAADAIFQTVVADWGRKRPGNDALVKAVRDEIAALPPR